MSKGFDVYQVHRASIQTADLIETAHNTGVLSPGIRLVTGEKASHSAVVIRFHGFNLHDDLFVCEAWWPDGLRLRRLSVLVDESDHVYWHPLVGRFGVDMAARCRAAGWLLANVGRPYDFWGAIAAGFGQARPDDGRLFCSEAAAIAYREGGIIDEIGNAPAPGEFDRYGIFGPVCEIKRTWIYRA